jgi:hypothetical protein
MITRSQQQAALEWVRLLNLISPQAQRTRNGLTLKINRVENTITRGASRPTRSSVRLR